MSRDGVMNFLSLNKSLTNLGGEIRQFRLPTMNPFPKLNSTNVRITHSGERRSVARPVARGTVIIEGDIGPLPEIATDMIDPSVSYAVENVKRERSGASLLSRVGLRHWVGRVLGSHRAARP
jgi:hypothetical protein